MVIEERARERRIARPTAGQRGRLSAVRAIVAMDNAFLHHKEDLFRLPDILRRLMGRSDGLIAFRYGPSPVPAKTTLPHFGPVVAPRVDVRNVAGKSDNLLVTGTSAAQTRHVPERNFGRSCTGRIQKLRRLELWIHSRSTRRVIPVSSSHRRYPSYRPKTQNQPSCARQR
jgi:hypothetical protein